MKECFTVFLQLIDFYNYFKINFKKNKTWSCICFPELSNQTAVSEGMTHVGTCQGTRTFATQSGCACILQSTQWANVRTSGT